MRRRHRTSLTVTVAVALLLPSGLAGASDPTTADCLAASDASLKLGNEHKLRGERAQLLVCSSSTCPTDIRKECVSRVAEVNPQIPTIIFAAKDAAGADLGAVKVTMDGEVLTDRLQGTAVSIDPGEHTFTFEAAGQVPVMKRLVIQQAQKDRRELISFGTGTKSVPVSPPVAPDADASPGLGAQKILALVAGGIGVVGVGVGSAFGLAAMSKKNDAQSACPGQCSSQDGVNKWSDAGAAGNLSTVGFVVGGVGLAGAAVLWLTASTSSSGANAKVGFGPGVLRVTGSF